MRPFAQFGTICKILKNVKNNDGGAILLIKLQAPVCNFTESITPSRVFFTFFNYTNVTKSHEVSHMTLDNRQPKMLKSQNLSENTLSTYSNIYLFKTNNRNTRTRCEICSE